MLGKTAHRRTTGSRARGAGAIVAIDGGAGGVASFAAPGLASDTIKVGAGETSIVVNGTTISTSNLTIAQLAKAAGRAARPRCRPSSTASRPTRPPQPP